MARQTSIASVTVDNTAIGDNKACQRQIENNKAREVTHGSRCRSCKLEYSPVKRRRSSIEQVTKLDSFCNRESL